MTGRSPWWTTAELRVLRAHYAAGGAEACATRLPGRSHDAITRMANKIGLRRVRAAHGFRTARALTTAQRAALDALAARPGPTRRQALRVAQAQGLPLHVVRHYITRRGNPIRRTLHRWTAGQDALLRQHADDSIDGIRHALRQRYGIPRTRDAVLMRMSILGISTRRIDRGGLTVRELCQPLGVSRFVVGHWVRRHGLPAHRWQDPRGRPGTGSLRGVPIIITHAALARFLRTHPAILARLRGTANRLFLADLLGEVREVRQTASGVPAIGEMTVSEAA